MAWPCHAGLFVNLAAKHASLHVTCGAFNTQPPLAHTHVRTRARTRRRTPCPQDHDGFITSADLLNLQQQLLGQHHMTRELAEDMMSEVSDCISDTHERKMDFEEVGA